MHITLVLIKSLRYYKLYAMLILFLEIETSLYFMLITILIKINLTN